MEATELGSAKEKKAFEKYITADEAAAALSEDGTPVSAKTLGEWARTRQCPSYKVNGRRRYRISELRAHMEEKRTQRTDPVER